MEYLRQLLARLAAHLGRRGYHVRRGHRPVQHHYVSMTQRTWDDYLDERDRQIRCGRLD